MTGELCDCFETKRDGVRHILAAATAVFPRAGVIVWSTAGRFVTVDEAIDAFLSVAAANWHALATHIGRGLTDRAGLLLDTGSTTTDIIPLVNGLPIPQGITDPARMQSGELIYTGVRRTPVCAVLGPDVAAEWFATTEDVYVRLGMLPPDPDNVATADQRPMTLRHAHGRLSRMLGGDPEVTGLDETMDLARRAFDRQRQIIGAGIRRVLQRMSTRPTVVFSAGSGEFLARAALEDTVRTGDGEEAPVESLAKRLGPGLSEAACAYAVARLAAEAKS